MDLQSSRFGGPAIKVTLVLDRLHALLLPSGVRWPGIRQRTCKANLLQCVPVRSFMELDKSMQMQPALLLRFQRLLQCCRPASNESKAPKPPQEIEEKRLWIHVCKSTAVPSEQTSDRAQTEASVRTLAWCAPCCSGRWCLRQDRRQGGNFWQSCFGLARCISQIQL